MRRVRLAGLECPRKTQSAIKRVRIRLDTVGMTRRAPNRPRTWIAPFHRAFTLLEVMVVIIIIGILGAIVVPQFTSATDDAKASALRSGLSGVRSSIAGFRAGAVLAGTPPFPTLAQLTAEGIVLTGGLPENPFNRRASVQLVTRTQADNRTVVNESSVGWNYFFDNTSTPPVAIFYANSDDEAGVDGSYSPIRANDY